MTGPQHAPSRECTYRLSLGSCLLERGHEGTHQIAQPDHAPSGEPDEIEVIRKRWHEGDGMRPALERITWTQRDISTLFIELDRLRADLAQRTAELAQVWQQRDAYLAELQQARAVVSAARAIKGTGHWKVDPLEGPTMRADGETEWYCAPAYLYAALNRALDHSPAVVGGTPCQKLKNEHPAW